MNRGVILLAGSAAVLAVAGCGGSKGELNIRSVSSTLAPGNRPVPARIAEARGQFALGNFALALEGFRKALRDEPVNVDALNGIAACYDRMGRFDVSRRYYEQALAAAPGDARLYANLAVSLQMQGRTAEAASVRAEMRQRLSAAETASVASASAAVETPAIATAQTVPARPVASAPLTPMPSAAAPSAVAPSAVAPSVSIALAPALPARSEVPATGARLERLSLGEVALVTSGKPVWKPRMAERFQDRAAPIRVTLLNAARVQGLAARTRSVLEGRGWRSIAIGDAPRVELKSVVAYPTARRAEAVRLSQQFGFALRHRPSADGRLVVLLGRDAASALRGGRAS